MTTSHHAPRHEHDQHRHEHDEHDHPHDQRGHEHSGWRSRLRHLLVPHSHDVPDSIDDELEATGAGIHAVKVSLVVLGLTALAQGLVVAASGSVALLADTVHNVSDALTALPLWLAFVLGRRASTPRFTYGFGRAEDLAGLFVVVVVAASAVVAGVTAVERLLDPRPVEHVGWVALAGVIGFAGNELVAVYRIRTGRRIGSAALVADGVHARTDGLTSLAVVLGAAGSWAGWHAADPIVGLVITAAIAALLWGTARDVGRRLLDGVDPDLTRQAQSTLARVEGVQDVGDLRLRWNGHRLAIEAIVAVPGSSSVSAADAVAEHAAAALRRDLPGVGTVHLRTTASGRSR